MVISLSRAPLNPSPGFLVHLPFQYLDPLKYYKVTLGPTEGVLRISGGNVRVHGPANEYVHTIENREFVLHGWRLSLKSRLGTMNHHWLQFFTNVYGS